MRKRTCVSWGPLQTKQQPIGKRGKAGGKDHKVTDTKTSEGGTPDLKGGVHLVISKQHRGAFALMRRVRGKAPRGAGARDQTHPGLGLGRKLCLWRWPQDGF